MRKNRLFIGLVAVAVGVVAVAGKGFAAEEGVKVSGDGASAVGVGLEGGAGVSVGGDEENRVGVSASGSAETKMKIESRDGEGSEVKSESSSSDDVEIKDEVSASGDEIRGWDASQKEEFLSTVKAEEELHSDQDLHDFAKGILLKDNNVESLNVATDTVEVSYREPAKLFGIFDSNLTAHVETDAEGHATVSYPWYGFFFSMPNSAASANLESKIEASLAGVNLKNNVQVLAHALGVIAGVLQTSGSASGSVSAGAN